MCYTSKGETMKVALYIASSGSLIDKGIDIWTGLHGYSHCEIVFEHVMIPADGKWLTCSASPRDGEVRFNKININSGHWHLVDIPEVDTMEKEAIVYNLLMTMVGDKYDWKGILLYFIFAFMKKQDNNKWWCSEIVGYILDRFGSPMKYRISPNKLAKKLNAPKQPFKFMFTFRKNY